MPPARKATQQEALNATVEGAKHARRQVLLGLGGLGLTAVAGWLGIAASRSTWPFEDEGRRRSVATLAGDLASTSSELRLAAIAGLRDLIEAGDSRSAAIAALVGFLHDHPPNATPAEISAAFQTIGRAGARDDEVDLRYADLRGLDVSDVRFRDGIPLFGANLDGTTIVQSEFGASNVGEASFVGTWLGGCEITGWNLIDSSLASLRAPGTTFASCQLAGADVSGADFSTSRFIDCDFTGRMLSSGFQIRPVTWASSTPPIWPRDFTPDL